MRPPPHLPMLNRLHLLRPLAWLLLFSPALFGQRTVVRLIAMPTPTEDATASDALGLEVNQSLLDKWRKKRDEALRAGANVIIFEITTPGGELLVAEEFLREIRALRSQGVRTVAYVPFAATSAGAIMALACGEVVLGPQAQIGNVIPLEFKDFFSMREAEGKVKTEVVNLMRSLGPDCHWPEILLEGMADKHLVLVALRDDVSGSVQVMSLEDFKKLSSRGLPENTSSRQFSRSDYAIKISSEDARYLKLPVAFAANQEELLRVLKIADRALLSEEVLQIKRSGGGLWGSNIGLNLPNLLGALLMILGIVFTIMELKTPGLGVFGALALVSFLGYFLLVSDSSSTVAITTSLLLLGFFFLLIEIIIFPGFGIPGVLGILLILGSLYVAAVHPDGDSLFQQLVPDTPVEWQGTKVFTVQLISSLILGVMGALFIARNLDHVPFLRHTLLKAPVLRGGQSQDPARTRQAVSPAGALALARGAIGTAETNLRPSGRVRFEKGPVDVVADGEWVKKGTRVKVILVEGNRVVVAPYPEERP